MPSVSLVWFRLDLRVDDNPALRAAVKRGGAVIPVYIWAPEEDGRWAPGGAAKYWLHHALTDLETRLTKIGSRLVLRQGKSLGVLKQLISETGADAVFWNRRYEPLRVKRDAEIKKNLKEDGLAVETFNSALLFEPWQVETGSKTPFKVFTAFWNKCLTLPGPQEPLASPQTLLPPKSWPESLALKKLKLEPERDWALGFRESWDMSASGAAACLKSFSSERLPEYLARRDLPDTVGTSRLSPYLHFGQISVRRAWHTIRKSGRAGAGYLRQLGWRDFAHHLMFHFPETPESALRPEYREFPWKNNAPLLKAWQKGLTGYPIVDAGMRELWHTGWMHNRVRMIAASFLVKDLLIPWQRGAEWFWDTLVDADLANNTLGWQWIAGCGADAAPYFRVFNPVLQGEKFDPGGGYVRRWVPELGALPDKWIHKPWEAPEEILLKAGVVLDKHYPRPVVDHGFARRRTLTAYESFRKALPSQGGH